MSGVWTVYQLLLGAVGISFFGWTLLGRCPQLETYAVLLLMDVGPA